MDIHAPEGPTRSFREFAIHILIVTIGILIALSLEGIRETIHNHHLVSETRENFRVELEADQEHCLRELISVRHANEQVRKLLIDLPELRTQPAALQARLVRVEYSGYFFADSSWQTALSTGALGHMTTAEVSTYASAFEGVREYKQIQKETSPAWIALRTFSPQQSQLSDSDFSVLTERLRTLEQYERSMEHVGREMEADIQSALKAK